MSYGNIIMTESAVSITGSNFCLHPVPGMYSGVAAAVVSVVCRVIRHPLFDGADTFHCFSFG